MTIAPFRRRRDRRRLGAGGAVLGDQLLDVRRALEDPLRREAERRGGADDRAGGARQRGHDDGLGAGCLELLHLGGEVGVAGLVGLAAGVGEPERVLGGLEAAQAVGSVLVVLVDDPDLELLGAALGHVVERVGDVDAVGRADRRDGRVGAPDRVERGRDGDELLALELRLDRLRRRAAERVQDRDVALERVVGLDVLLRLVAGVLDGELDLPAVDAAAGVERLEERLVAGGDRLAERGGRAAERVEVADADRLGRRVDAGAGLERAVARRCRWVSPASPVPQAPSARLVAATAATARMDERLTSEPPLVG